MVEGESLDKFFLGVDFLLGAIVPAEVGEVVEHGFGKNAIVAVFGDGFGAITLA